ncbi:hypothetical protein V7S43_014445 [Phytophthora oleae]|uniref:Bacterial surface antigen (D15) domain-containing protein n=1 Tax=Phytophthora oleae TaxID=2107226 RepID=A0ABD3F2Q4_9STRA
MKDERLRIALRVRDFQFNASNAFNGDLVIPANRDRATTGGNVSEPLRFMGHVTSTARINRPGGVRFDLGLSGEANRKVDSGSNSNKTGLAASLAGHFAVVA